MNKNNLCPENQETIELGCKLPIYSDEIINFCSDNQEIIKLGCELSNYSGEIISLCSNNIEVINLGFMNKNDLFNLSH